MTQYKCQRCWKHINAPHFNRHSSVCKDCIYDKTTTGTNNSVATEISILIVLMILAMLIIIVG